MYQLLIVGRSFVSSIVFTRLPNNLLTKQFIAMLLSIMAMISTIPAVIVLLKLKGEEQQNRAEHFFSRAMS